MKLRQWTSKRRHKRNHWIVGRVGYVCAGYFTQRVRFNVATYPNITAAEYYTRYKDSKIYEYLHRYPTDDKFRAVQFLSRPPAQFPPTIALQCFHWLSRQLYPHGLNILDPFAGWGDRLVAAMATNVDRYTGLDTNTNLIDAYQDIIEFYRPFSTTSSNMLSISAFDLELSTVHFNCIFSSPPFFLDTTAANLLEEYPFIPISEYSIFMRELVDFMHRASHYATWIIFHLPSHMATYISTHYKPWTRVFLFRQGGNNRTGRTMDHVYCWKTGTSSGV